MRERYALLFCLFGSHVWATGQRRVCTRCGLVQVRVWYWREDVWKWENI